MERFYLNCSIEKYYENLKTKKFPPDELSLILLAKWLRRNITIVTSKEIWSVYARAKPDLVICYRGKDQNKPKHPGKWIGTCPFKGAKVRSKYLKITFKNINLKVNFYHKLLQIILIQSFYSKGMSTHFS